MTIPASPSIRTLEEILAAFNAHDLDAIMQFFADDCELLMPRGKEPWGTRHVGKAAVREGLATRFAGLPDVHYGEDRHWVAGDVGVSTWLLTGTTKSGETIRVRGVDLLEFRGGRIVKKDSYWKIVEKQEQYGKPLSDSTFHTHRVIPHEARAVFDAFARPELLARWWGPNGFTNAFEAFDFRTGGRWKFVMHGPDGSNHPNESVFLEATTPSRIVIHHISPPRFVLTVTLTPHDRGTSLSWVQEFEDAAVAARIRHIAEPANEQNLDRLVAILAGTAP